MHEEQDAHQVLPGTAGSSKALAAPRVLPPKTSSADSQISSPSARKSQPVLEQLSRDGVYVNFARGGAQETAAFIWKHFFALPLTDFL